MKQIEVQIMQQSYLLGCPEGGESRLLDAVERLDTAMTRIRAAGRVRARDRIAVLAALNFAFELADRDVHALSSARAAAAATAAAVPQQVPDAGDGGAADAALRQRTGALLQRLDRALAADARSA